jgi:hypothetical protein
MKAKGCRRSRAAAHVDQPQCPAKTAVGFHGLGLFQYSELADPSRDIRVVELLPGEFNDAIRIMIRHRTLVEKTGPLSRQVGLKELQLALSGSPGWEVQQLRSGRYLFINNADGKVWETKWRHPNPDVDPSLVEMPVAHGEPTYEAVSYVWGSQKSSDCVVVESTCPPTRIPVRPNLSTMLRYLRGSAMPRTLWIDALCINQEDERERGTQVARMGDIYRLAYRVVAWLGPATRWSEVAMAALRQCGTKVEFTKSGEFVAAPGTDGTWYPLISFDSGTLDAIEEFTTNIFFTRLWILQELALASRFSWLQAGHDTLPLSTAANAFFYLYSGLTEPDNINRFFAPLRNCALTVGAWPQMPVRYILRATRMKACADPRDHVYAILGICPPSLRSLITTDYGSTTSPVDVYRKFVMAEVQRSHRLDILKFVDYCVPILPVPSWVPDLSTNTGRYNTLLPGQNSAGNSRAHSVFEGSDTLKAVGKLCGVVRKAYELDGLNWSSRCQLAMSMSKGIGEPSLSGYSDDGGILQTLVIALCSGRTRERVADRYYPTSREWTHDCMVCAGGGSSALPALVQMAQGDCDGRTLIDAGGQCAGLGPGGASPGMAPVGYPKHRPLLANWALHLCMNIRRPYSSLTWLPEPTLTSPTWPRSPVQNCGRVLHAVATGWQRFAWTS